jgi:uncharacterized OB-fold protein
MNSPVKNWRDTKKLSRLLGKIGKLIVWTQVSTPPTGFEYQAPYFVGIVELNDKKRLPLQIIDCREEDLKTNLRVKLVIRRLKKPGPNDVIDYTIKATPA